MVVRGLKKRETLEDALTRDDGITPVAKRLPAQERRNSIYAVQTDNLGLDEIRDMMERAYLYDWKFNELHRGVGGVSIPFPGKPPKPSPVDPTMNTRADTAQAQRDADEIMAMQRERQRSAALRAQATKMAQQPKTHAQIVGEYHIGEAARKARDANIVRILAGGTSAAAAVTGGALGAVAGAALLPGDEGTGAMVGGLVGSSSAAAAGRHAVEGAARVMGVIPKHRQDL